MTLLVRSAVGVVLAIGVAYGARRARALSGDGAAAAAIIGSLAVAAGWSWAALLVIYFVPAALLSRVGRDRRDARIAGIVAKSGARDARQVLANGGVFALAALASIVLPWPGWSVVGAGALAASAADSWATEVGTLAGGTPRSIASLEPVPPGLSGGVTAPGTAAAIAGALFMALAAWALGWPRAAAAGVFVGGIAGSFADSVAGATLQERRRCDECGERTERMVHSCGMETRYTSGVAWLDNDGVNVLCTLAGAVAAVVAAPLLAASVAR